jgi:SSS family solute:Na+ symporter
MGRFILTNVGIETTPGSLLDLFLNVNFLHFAFYLFVLCTIVLFIVSYSTPEPALENVKGLTYEKKQVSEKLTFESVQNMTKGVEDRIYSLLLVVCVVLVWIFFA